MPLRLLYLALYAALVVGDDLVLYLQFVYLGYAVPHADLVFVEETVDQVVHPPAVYLGLLGQFEQVF